MSVGGLMASQTRQFQHMSLDAGWRPRPRPDSDADVDQAIAAKIAIAVPLMTVLASAQLVVIDPEQVSGIPPWMGDEELFAYASQAVLPASPVFLDFESEDGMPVAWVAESWPLPFHLRGAVCWADDDMLSVVPFGSVGGQHPWDGTDYQAWARWVFLRNAPAVDAIGVGAGDVVVAPDGRAAPWVDPRVESICAHQSMVAFHLVARVLRVLWAMEMFELKPVVPSLPRPERRRIQRAGMTVGLVVPGLSRVHSESDLNEDVDDSSLVEACREECPLPKTHRTLIAAHTFWHEAAEAYQDPVLFRTKLNALIQTLRNITWALQKEIAHEDRVASEWYPGWQARMGEDPKLRWVKRVRNRVVKQNDLEAHSRARLRISAPGVVAPAVDIDVDPSATAAAIARIVRPMSLPPVVRDEGTLVVERRWIVDDFPEEDVLDLLAHCYGTLWRLVAEGHEQMGGSLASCEEVLEDPCVDSGLSNVGPSGRPGCMWAGRAQRVTRRNLSNGVPTGVTSKRWRPQTTPDVEREVVQRYGVTDWPTIPTGAAIDEAAAIAHEHARRIFAVDGSHITICWLMRDGVLLGQQVMWPEDQRAKFMMMEALAEDISSLGANELILTAEAWEAVVLPAEDPRAELRAGDREDRTEILLTQALKRGRDGVKTWSTSIARKGHGVDLGPVHVVEAKEAPAFAPIFAAWEDWPALDP